MDYSEDIIKFRTTGSYIIYTSYST